MTENSRSGLDTGLFLYLFRNLLCAADTLGNDDDDMLLAIRANLFYTLDHLAEITLHLGNENRSSSAGDTRVQRDMTRVSAHYLDNGAALMRMACVAQLVYQINNCIECGIVADSVLGTLDIVVDSPGDTYAGDSRL